MATLTLISVVLLLMFVIRKHAQSQSVNVTFQTIANHTLPFQWSGGISFVYDEKLTLLGGRRNGGSPVLNERYTLDLSSIQWADNESTILPSSFNQNAWQQHSTLYPSLTSSDYSSLGIISFSQQWTVNGDRVYIAAPYNLTLSDFLIYDMTQSQFMDPSSYQSEGAAPNVGGSCLTNNHTHVFVLGGRTHHYSTQFDTNRIYNVDSDSWSEGASMLNRRSHFACQHNFDRDTLYIFGGSVSTLLRDLIERYDIASDEWTDLSPVTLSSKANRLRCILDEVNRNCIYCIGGYGGDDLVVLDSVDVFDTISETITTSHHALPVANDASAVTFYHLNGNGIVFSIGGGTNSFDLDIIQYTAIRGPPTEIPTTIPTQTPSAHPTIDPTETPTQSPSKLPTKAPTQLPTTSSTDPTATPSEYPTIHPSIQTTAAPTLYPTKSPSDHPMIIPTLVANPAVIRPLSTNSVTQSLSTVDRGTTELIDEKEEAERKDNTAIIIIVSLLLILILVLGIGIYYWLKQKKNATKISENMSNAGTKKDAEPQRTDEAKTVEMNTGKTSVALSETKNAAVGTEDELTDEDCEDMYVNKADTTGGGPTGCSDIPQHVYAEQVYAEELCVKTKGSIATATATGDATGSGETEIGSDDEEGEANELKDWLDKKVEMMEYYQCFVNNGLNSLESIKNIKDRSDLQDIGIEKIDHQYAIMHHINQLRK